ncbi:hypothetical protein PENPOL_c007G05316 [Penicillium polonicum]|uniref:Uncharacterized protein n=1 Tax=Penicillium polonicum TaxID=60169 RepID=A0A1V6NK38_PENPO|nr:hypothetical protein PENPOL_c007G05316 [Penicillium polonicum]
MRLRAPSMMVWALRLSFVGSGVASVLLGVGLDLLGRLGSAMGAVSTERPIWAPGDPNPAKPSADTPEARACAPLATTVEWDNEDQWVSPPAGVKLSDELAYATKSTMSNKSLKPMYTFDFDGNGIHRLNVSDSHFFIYTYK